jgi:hypothetical protein
MDVLACALEVGRSHLPRDTFLQLVYLATAACLETKVHFASIVRKGSLLTLGSLSPPESLCIFIGGQIIGTESDVLRLKDAQDVFYATGDQRTRNREVGAR